MGREHGEEARRLPWTRLHQALRLRGDAGPFHLQKGGRVGETIDEKEAVFVALDNGGRARGGTHDATNADERCPKEVVDLARHAVGAARTGRRHRARRGRRQEPGRGARNRRHCQVQG